jgi:C_GCAxxG_C_C family probable redox protein
MDRVNDAINSFNNGFNCAQAVLTAFSKDMGLDDELAFKISCGFGGGMGRLQATCGAITGAYMAIGLKYGKSKKEDLTNQDLTYQQVRDFNDQFIRLHKTTNCRDLLNCDLRTDEGQDFFKKNGLKVKICEKCIKNAVQILETII